MIGRGLFLSDHHSWTIQVEHRGKLVTVEQLMWKWLRCELAHRSAPPRDLIRERTQAGLAAARARGRRGGRPTVLSPVKRKQAIRMITEGTPIVEVAQALGVSRPTLYRQLRPMPAPGT